MAAYDFSVLDQPLSRDELREWKAENSSVSPRFEREVVMTGVTIIFIAFIVSFIIAVMASSAGGGNGVYVFVIGFFLLITWIFVFAMQVVLRRQKQLALLFKFAKANGLKLLYDKREPGYKGLIFQEGRGRTIKEAVVFPTGFEIGNYEYVTGSGKSRTVHTHSYARVQLSKYLPHMVLDAKVNNILGFTNLPIAFSKSQQLLLEGDFNKYFTLYAPNEYKTDALYVFTPDVMQALIENGKNFDIEVIENELYFYGTYPLSLTSSEVMAKTVNIIATLHTELHAQTKRYVDHRVASTDGMTTPIAASGKRLKTSLAPATIVFFIIIIIWYAFRLFSP